MKRRPRLNAEDVPYYNAFQRLSQSRPQGMSGDSAIPMSEILAYCLLVGIVVLAERSKYLTLILDLDTIYLTHQAEEAKKRAP